MERSPAVTFNVSPSLGAVALLDVLTRLAAPMALLAWTEGEGTPALVVAIAAGGMGVVRGVLAGWVAESTENRLWRRLVSAIRATDIVTLKARSHEEQTWRIVDAAHRHVDLQVQVMPRLLADGCALALTAGAVVYFLGALWLVLGALAMAVLAVIVAPGQRAIRKAELASWGHLTELGAELDVLLEGAAEIRVHGQEQALAEAMFEHGAHSAAMRRRAQTVSALIGLAPVVLIVLGIGVSTLLRNQLAGFDLAFVSRASVLGGAAFVFALSLVRSAEAFAHAAPQRRLLARYLDGADVARTRDEAVSPQLIELDEVSVTYPGADRATPAPVSHRWPPGRGLTLAGPNGAGKTTLAHCLLGLIRPTSGAVRFDGAQVDSEALASFRAAAVYLPQSPYLAPDRTVGWHLRLVAPLETSDDELEQALARVDLLSTLRARESTPLDALAGSLSGGERRRLFLARLFIPRATIPSVMVLDEPEAGLDREARAWLREQLTELARGGRVLVIVHDASVVPADFDRVDCA